MAADNGFLHHFKQLASEIKMKKGLKIAVLCGGSSAEHDVSLASGTEVAASLKKTFSSVVIFDPYDKSFARALMDYSPDVVFLALHGIGGEDGTIQGFLETLGVAYTGSGVLSSSLSMSKSHAKSIYLAEGINTPQGLLVHRGEKDAIERFCDKCDPPYIIKPNNEGSAIGVCIASSEGDLKALMEREFEGYKEVLIERYISGVELTVAVLGTSNPIALPPIEIIPKNEFYDYESKYAKGGSRHICPADIDSNLITNCKELAVKAHQALGCVGVSRTDMILDGQGGLWVLETNTLPGMTATSLLPDAVRVFGLNFDELCLVLIAFALEGE